MLMYGRNQHNIVKQSPPQLKINKLKIKIKSVSVVEGDVSYGKQIFSCEMVAAHQCFLS